MVRNIKLSNEEYQYRLDNYKIVEWELIGDYLGGNSPVNLKHKVCGGVVEHLSAKNVFRVKNCKLCNPEKFKKTHEQVAEDLLNLK